MACLREILILEIHDDANILVVAHDAGGAEIVSSWVAHNPNYVYSFLLDGPATGVFTKKLGDISILSKDALSFPLQGEIDVVLTATSWASGVEKKALNWASKKGIYSISYLDHWCNYISRFQDGSELVLPDEIWVGDEDAYRIARSCFGEYPIYLVPNPHFMDVKKSFLECNIAHRDSSRLRVLYVCEAFSEAGIKLPSGELVEYRSMDLFFEHLKSIAPEDVDVAVRLRAHPAEEPGKYAEYLVNSELFKVGISESTTLVEDCVWADWVVGMNSMALIIARIGGSRVFYCNLDAAKPNNLPTTGLENFLKTTHLWEGNEENIIKTQEIVSQ